MSLYEFPMTEQGQDQGDDGYVITRQHKGFEDIQHFWLKTRKQFNEKSKALEF